MRASRIPLLKTGALGTRYLPMQFAIGFRQIARGMRLALARPCPGGSARCSSTAPFSFHAARRRHPQLVPGQDAGYTASRLPVLSLRSPRRRDHAPDMPGQNRGGSFRNACGIMRTLSRRQVTIWRPRSRAINAQLLNLRAVLSRRHHPRKTGCSVNSSPTVIVEPSSR
jgi:hypothetical protein